MNQRSQNAQSTTREFAIESDNLRAILYEREWIRHTDNGDVPTTMYSYRIFRLKKRQGDDTRQFDRLFLHMMDENRDLLWRVEEKADELRRAFYERRQEEVVASLGPVPEPE